MNSDRAVERWPQGQTGDGSHSGFSTEQHPMGASTPSGLTSAAASSVPGVPSAALPRAARGDCPSEERLPSCLQVWPSFGQRPARLGRRGCRGSGAGRQRRLDSGAELGPLALVGQMHRGGDTRRPRRGLFSLSARGVRPGVLSICLSHSWNAWGIVLSNLLMASLRPNGELVVVTMTKDEPQ